MRGIFYRFYRILTDIIFENLFRAIRYKRIKGVYIVIILFVFHVSCVINKKKTNGMVISDEEQKVK